MVDSADNSPDSLSAGAVAEFVAFASAIAEEAGEGIASRFRDRSFAVESKDDGTPVTEVDLEAEALLRGRIAARYPDHGIIGEELGEEGRDREFVWILDPIDGTKSFVHGVPLFGTLVGLLHRGRPVVGLIHQPVLGRLAVGDNRGTWLNGKPARVRAPRPMEDATFLLTDPADPRLSTLGTPFAEMLGEAALVRSWGDCFGYLSLVSGMADVMIDPVLSPWDLLPLLPLLRGAGAVVSGFDGRPPEEGSSLVATTGRRLHGRVLRGLGAASLSDGE